MKKLLIMPSKLTESSEELISDSVYDIAIDILNEQSSCKYLSQIVKNLGEEVKLKYHMGSMNKFKLKDNENIKKWLIKYKGNYCISDKLMVSLMHRI